MERAKPGSGRSRGCEASVAWTYGAIGKAIASFALATTCAFPAHAAHWSRSWAAAPQTPLAEKPIPDLKNAIVKQTVRLSSGGSRLRLRVSNEMSQSPLRIDNVSVVAIDRNGRALSGAAVPIEFGGRPTVMIPRGAPLLSDPVSLSLPPLSRLSISIHFPEGTPSPSVHVDAAATTVIMSAERGAKSTPLEQRILLTAVDVDSGDAARTIVTFGDSITDAGLATTDADTRWPDVLAERLQKAGMTSIGVANVGIAGTRVLSNGFNALERFDRDALSAPAVSHIIVLEGINDIRGAWRDNRPDSLSANDLIDGYRQLIIRAHDRGVKIIFGTVLPCKGTSYWSEWGEQVRLAVNAWIRDNHESDGFVDFDRAVRDPADPASLIKAYDSGDKLHPNDAGLKKMAESVDLALLR